MNFLVIDYPQFFKCNFGWVKLWRLASDSSNSPKFSPATILHYTVDMAFNPNYFLYITTFSVCYLMFPQQFKLTLLTTSAVMLFNNEYVVIIMNTSSMTDNIYYTSDNTAINNKVLNLLLFLILLR